MNCRTHKELYHTIIKELPSTFGFEFASVLFSEDSESLYAVDGETTNSEGGNGEHEHSHGHDDEGTH